MAKTNTEKLDVKLKYTGIEVEDGTMSVEDFIEAVQGFSGVYGRLASTNGAAQKHKIRITGVEKGSVDILLEVKQFIDLAGQNAEGIQALIGLGTAVAGGGWTIIKIISWLIQFVKHVKKKPHTTQIKDGGMIQIQNFENVSMEMPTNIYNIYKDSENGIKNDLYKIAKPLEEGRIESAKIEAWSEDEHFEVEISANEKTYFDPKEEDLTQTKKTWIQGSFNSLTKSTARGQFYLTDGSRVTYEFQGDTPEKFYEYFLHKGLVRVNAIVHLDQNLKPMRLDIFEIEKLQLDFGFNNLENSDSDE